MRAGIAGQPLRNYSISYFQCPIRPLMSIKHKSGAVAIADCDIAQSEARLSKLSRNSTVETELSGGVAIMMESLQRLWLGTSLRLKNLNLNDESGVTTVEYAAMLVLVAIAVIIATPNISSAVVAVFDQIGKELQPVTP